MFMLSVIMSSVFYTQSQIKSVMLNVIILSVIMLNVIMLSVIIVIDASPL